MRPDTLIKFFQQQNAILAASLGSEDFDLDDSEDDKGFDSAFDDEELESEELESDLEEDLDLLHLDECGRSAVRELIAFKRKLGSLDKDSDEFRSITESSRMLISKIDSIVKECVNIIGEE